MKPVYHPSAQSGFTLVEILITLVVIAIMAALVSPAIMQMAPNMALKSAAQDLYSNIQKAKIQAIKENGRAVIVFNASSYYYFIDLDNDGAYTPSAVDTFTDENLDGMYNPGEPFVDVDGNNIYSGEIAVSKDLTDYGYGITQGCGNAAKNWAGNDCIQMGTIQFNSRGLANMSGSVYIHNRNTDISYAVTVRNSGSIKGSKYDGATPFATAHWVQ
jgi:prepilin-type N-terminal cleavage/methylation domain-containing protein